MSTRPCPNRSCTRNFTWWRYNVQSFFWKSPKIWALVRMNLLQNLLHIILKIFLRLNSNTVIYQQLRLEFKFKICQLTWKLSLKFKPGYRKFPFGTAKKKFQRGIHGIICAARHEIIFNRPSWHFTHETNLDVLKI